MVDDQEAAVAQHADRQRGDHHADEHVEHAGVEVKAQDLAEEVVAGAAEPADLAVLEREGAHDGQRLVVLAHDVVGVPRLRLDGHRTLLHAL